MAFVEIEYRVNNFDRVARALPRETSLILRKGATDIFAHSQIQVPRRTSHLALSGAVRLGDTECEIYYGADYSGFVHEGTRHNRPNPFLKRSLDAVTPSMVAAFMQLETRL